MIDRVNRRFVIVAKKKIDLKKPLYDTFIFIDY